MTLYFCKMAENIKINLSIPNLEYKEGFEKASKQNRGENPTKPRENATVFHAAVAATERCAEELLKQKAANKTIDIFSTTQTAIRVLSVYQVSSGLGTQNEVT